MSTSENNAKCFFMYFLIFILAFLTCYGAYGIAHFLIKYMLFSTSEIPTKWSYSIFRGDIAQVLIGFPSLVFAVFMAQRDLQRDIYSTDNPFRRWILYAAMGVSCVFVFFGLIQIFRLYLAGSLIQQAVLRFAIMVTISGLAFSYFLVEVSKDREKITLIQWVIAIIATVVSITAFGYGIKYNKSEKEADTYIKERERAKKAKKKPAQKSRRSRKRRR